MVGESEFELTHCVTICCLKWDMNVDEWWLTAYSKARETEIDCRRRWGQEKMEKNARSWSLSFSLVQTVQHLERKFLLNDPA